MLAKKSEAITPIQPKKNITTSSAWNVLAIKTKKIKYVITNKPTPTSILVLLSVILLTKKQHTTYPAKYPETIRKYTEAPRLARIFERYGTVAPMGPSAEIDC
jgi:hypothetical protein